MKTQLARELKGKKEIQEVREKFKQTYFLFYKVFTFSDCTDYKEGQRWDMRSNIHTITIADWKGCRDRCSEWVGENNELCEFWQWRRSGSGTGYCNFKKGTPSNCGQPDRTGATGQFSGRCPPPSSSTCDDGIRYGKNMIQTFNKELWSF